MKRISTPLVGVILLLPLVLSLTGCATKMKGTEFYRAENFRLTETRGKNVGLLLINDGSKTGFKKSFDKVYGSEQEFLERLTDLLIVNLEAHAVRVETLSVANSVLERIAESEFDKKKPIGAYPPEPVRRDLIRLASRSRVDVILLVRRWSIRSIVDMEPDSSTTFCVVDLEGGIFDARGEMLFYVGTSGFHQVIPFFFKTALKSAVADAAEKFAGIMAGVWPVEQLQEIAVDPRYREKEHE